LLDALSLYLRNGMSRLPGVLAVGLCAVSGSLRAQEQGGFVITRGMDTVAVEQFSREDVELKGRLVRVAGKEARERVRYRATLVDDQSAPLVDLSAWRADDPEDMPARQTARVIFRDDSVAVDDASRWSGALTRVLPTIRTAVPYLQLSTAFLEQATRRAAAARGDSLAVPFFNLGGGQTVTGTVRHLSGDSASVRIGSLEFRLRVDTAGRVLGGSVPSQGLVITRSPAS
jgi:hypothetical protein